jgi:KDO2-lipid IV(A) lauroyltransferase
VKPDQAVVTVPPQAAEAGAPDAASMDAVRAGAAAFWLTLFFFAAQHAPRLVTVLQRPFCRGVFFCSRAIRAGTTANARRLLGPGASDRDVTALARRTLGSFYLFCCDVGRSFGLSREQLAALIDSDEGHAHYVAARAAGKGVIVVTAHMGSFEVGMAALRRVERNAIHVVFKRDPFARFERQRSALRARLGVEEAPVDDGWTIWVRLRDALLNDHAVVLQGDRVMPGQKGEAVPFLGGTLLLPGGPVKLALATGAPIVPIFSVRLPNGKVKLFIEPPIDAGATDGGPRGGPHPALLKFASVLERYVKAYPDQWLLLQPALVEDTPPKSQI